MGKRPRLKMEVRTITPRIAQALLDRNIGNRNIRQHYVLRLAREMREGRWRIGEPILLDKDGNLLDGQHRLRAVLVYGKPCQFAFVSGYDRAETFGVIGQAATRTTANWLEIEGRENAKMLAAVLRLYWYHMKFGCPTKGSGMNANPSPLQLLHLEQTIGHKVYASMAKVPPQIVRVAPRSLMILLHMLFAEKDEDHADVFMDDLTNGTRLGSRDPVYHLRERLIANRARVQQKMTRTSVVANTIKAWNYDRQGRKLTSSKGFFWRENEGFPVVK